MGLEPPPVTGRQERRGGPSKVRQKPGVKGECSGKAQEVTKPPKSSGCLQEHLAGHGVKQDSGLTGSSKSGLAGGAPLVFLLAMIIRN